MAKFVVNDRVRFVRTGGDTLENATGTILGPTMESVGPDGYFIVLLDYPLSDRRAVVFTEHCLEPLFDGRTRAGDFPPSFPFQS